MSQLNDFSCFKLKFSVVALNTEVEMVGGKIDSDRDYILLHLLNFSHVHLVGTI